MRRLCLLGLTSWVFSTPAMAQIKPDGSVGTQVMPNVLINGVISDSSADLTVRIDGGTIKGANLFHSFSEFNISSGQGVYFTNPAGITNILTRVTGTNPSHIDGTLGVLGNANLFLLNPNGILFGANARLDLQGSFLGTTASIINFADGTNFSASDSQVVPLLTVSVPVGLGFGSNSGAIQVQGSGHSLTVVNPFFSPITRESTITGLQVQPFKTLALVGGDVTLDGGTLKVAGRIELGSVGSGVVSLTPNETGVTGWTLGYKGVQNFRDIHLSQKALLDASGNGSGSIQIQGSRVTIADGSLALIQNQGIQPSGKINVNASKSLELSGTTQDESLGSSLRSETVFLGNAGDIAIVTPTLVIRDGAQITTRTFSGGEGGSITVDAPESLQVLGFSPVTKLASSILSATYSAGRAGNISLSTGRLTALNGGAVSSATLSGGSAGDVTVNATDLVEVLGVEPISLQASILSSDTTSQGDAGSLTVNTSRLIVRDGGRIDSSTLGSGAAKSVTVNASMSVEVSGTVPGSRNPSQIISSANIIDKSLQQFFGVLPVPSGVSGNVTINTGRLSVSNGGLVNVKNDGAGDGGVAIVNANSIVLDSQGAIAASAQSGKGGNIFLQAHLVQLRHNSGITAAAGEGGDGGNIKIDAGALAQLENSNITANAVQGKGGNIQIASSGLFQSLDSKITASSELGISGQVKISNPDVKQQNNLLQQPSSFVSAEKVVATSCLATRNIAQGRFVVTGEGGLPETPNNKLELPYSVVPVTTVIGMKLQSVNTNSVKPVWKLGDKLQEATQLVATTDGHLLLQTTPTKTIASAQTLTCASNSKAKN